MGEPTVDAVAIYHAPAADRRGTPMVALNYDVQPGTWHALLQNLAGRGWRDPSPVFDGVDGLTSAVLSLRSVDGRTLVIEDGTDVLFEGVIVPPDGWLEQVRALGAVGVIAGAGITAAADWERQLPRLARDSELLGSIATVTFTDAFGREHFRAFAYEVLSALRPALPPDALHEAGFALEDDRPQRAILEVVDSAVRHRVAVPARIVDSLQRRAADRTSFGWRDARTMKRLLRKIHTS
ncbi:hypothetical protein [Rhodococcus sp. NCIMB 12038]|uniref:hypothetical protein n=1 Tax=Rhodococcus sp. NCIMB 12038 TaxID=933800 RepID=UPI000B3D2536|nr:hypothetical protein [Rhodococcus sp. NCIMB 12038]OUS95233.1 hypothetical protein CA951_14490 [Rhodococcus sp. NCIMB 12038]